MLVIFFEQIDLKASVKVRNIFLESAALVETVGLRG